jgi:[glutamine synthetase] adenylyltransferase / [glutamine synthetase]-adenylyl-L-tyrosine phosphorylase
MVEDGGPAPTPAGELDDFHGIAPAEPALSASTWLDIARRQGDRKAFLASWNETWREILAAPDPELAFSIWTRWVEDDREAAQTPEGLPAAGSRAEAWAGRPELREGFIRLAGSSPALGEILLASWREFRPWEWRSGWESRASFSRRVERALEDRSDREFPDAIRKLARIECLRIAYLDCVAGMPVDQVTLQISTVADTLIEACYRRAFAQVSSRLKRAPPPGGFVVLALGKLGGGELNYSSDVDLNFVYDETAVLGTGDGREIRDPLEVERFFTLLSERIVHLVADFTEQGRLYRLDTRLRPEGSTGRLVWSMRATVDYYYGMGRAWERQALIRLRPVAGDLGLGERLQGELDAFVFPRTFTAEEIAEIRGLKLQMEKLAMDRGSATEIKIGKGGIRDVEYIVQYLQLVHAASVPVLKKANMFQAFEILESSGLLKPEESDILRQGYRFLRRVEHRIQMQHLRQTHQLPEDPRDLLRIARSLGFPGIDAFRGRLDAHSRRIRRVYSLLFEEATAPRREIDELPLYLDLPADVGRDPVLRILRSFGFEDAERAFARLKSLAGGAEDPRALDGARAKEAFSRLALPLLHEVSRQPEPDRTLSNFEECTRALGARSIFYQLLVESPRVLQLFVEICARSSLVVETIRAYPDLFDEVVDALLTGYTFDRSTLLADVNALFQAAPADEAGRRARIEEALFKLKHLHFLLIALRDLERLDNLSTTLGRIADLSETLLHGVLRLALEEAETRLGSWPSKPGFLLLALGKLGGQEMSYKSDLDLVFLYEGKGSTAGGVGVEEYFERLSHLVLAGCAVTDSVGPLLRIDMRLRPLGSHNSLAISLDVWRQYFLGGQARTWERQAFLRARPVEGDEALSRTAMEFVRRELVLGSPSWTASRETVFADVLEMRRKLEAHAKPGDLKRGRGGIMDVEFIVQALQLVHGKAHPGVLGANTAAGIQKLMEAGFLDPSHGSELLTAYQFLRWIENRISLVSEGSQSLATLSHGELDSLAQKIGYRSSGEESAVKIFESELEYCRRKNRLLLETILGGPIEKKE